MSIATQTPIEHEAFPSGERSPTSEYGVDRVEAAHHLTETALHSGGLVAEKPNPAPISVLPTEFMFAYVREQMRTIQEKIDIVDEWLLDLHTQMKDVQEQKQALLEKANDLELFQSSTIGSGSLQQASLANESLTVFLLQETININTEINLVEKIKEKLKEEHREAIIALEKAEHADFQRLQDEGIGV